MLNPHRGTDGIAIRLRPSQMEANAVVSRKLVVTVKIRGAIVCRDEQVEIAVAVKISVRQPAADFRRTKPFAQIISYIAKHALSVVQKKLRRLRVADIAADISYGIVDVAIHYR
jgi:hypothetical protein